MDILIGTRNKYKVAEMMALLGRISGVKICFLDELGVGIRVEEDQETLRKNAEKKAVEISRLTDCYVIASDGGVDIPGLGKKWDILRNQRTVGEDKTDLEKAKRLLSLMKGLKNEERRAVYYLALALAKNGKLIWSAEGIYDEGYIAEKLPDRQIPQSRWMGHLWYYPRYEKVNTKLSEKEKKEVRKRGEELKKSLQSKIREVLFLTKDCSG